MDLEKG